MRRLGSTRKEAVDIAVVAATSVDLERAVNERRFRQDLYHPLAVITRDLPPLRSRGTDILTLAEHFLARACADYGLSPRVLLPEARSVLAGYSWPGNVRQLANAMERVVLLSDRDEIPAAQLAFLRVDTVAAVGPAPIEHAERHGTTGSLDDALRARVESALRETGGNIRRTAVLLGISRNTLRARMATYGLVRHGPLPGAQRPPAASAAGLRPQWERRHLRSCASHSGRHRPTIRHRTQHHSLGPVVGLLLARTEGNPLFLEKHVRTLRETGVLVGERGASRLLASVATVETAPTVQAS